MPCRSTLRSPVVGVVGDHGGPGAQIVGQDRDGLGDLRLGGGCLGGGHPRAGERQDREYADRLLHAASLTIETTDDRIVTACCTDARGLRLLDRDDHRRHDRDAGQQVRAQLLVDRGRGPFALGFELQRPQGERVVAQQELGAHLLEVGNRQTRHRVTSHRDHRHLDPLSQQVAILLRRSGEHVPGVRLPARILQPQVFTQPVLRPHRVVETKPDAGGGADAVERAHRAGLAGGGAGGGVGGQVVEDVQQPEAVHVLRAVEEAAELPRHFLDPGVAAANLRGRDGGQAGRCRHAEQSGKEAATGMRVGVMHEQLLGKNGFT